MAKGIDCASPLNAKTAAGVKVEHDFVARYYAPSDQKYNWKRLTKQEVQAITNARLNIVSVFESYAGRAKEGQAAGTADGVSAMQTAQALGQPKGTAIYFAVDYAAPVSDYDSIEAYFKAAAAQLPGYVIRPYGSYFLIEEMVRRGICKKGWQTIAWSRDHVSKHAAILQNQNGVNVAGVSVDLDESFGDEGWWNLNMPEQSFTDVKADAWYAADVAKVQSEGLMSGYPDGTFKPEQPVTRAELAAVLSRLSD